MKEFLKCFTDYRDQDAIGHTVEELLSQRIQRYPNFDKLVVKKVENEPKTGV
jgi:hypothetical protein